MILLLAALAHAGDSPLFSGAGTPWTIGEKNGAFGLFRPVTVGFGDKTDVSANGLWFFLAPSVEAKRTVWSSGSFAVAATGNLAFPTYGLRFLQTGFLQPVVAHQEIAPTLVGGVGGVAGWRNDALAVSVRVRTRFGAPLGESTVQFQDLAWLDPLIAPVVSGWSVQPGVRVDWTPSDGWVLTADGRVELSGGPDFGGKLFVLRALGDHVAVGAGIAGAMERYTYGYPDWDAATLATPPAVFRDFSPLFDVQGRW